MKVIVFSLKLFTASLFGAAIYRIQQLVKQLKFFTSNTCVVNSHLVVLGFLIVSNLASTMLSLVFDVQAFIKVHDEHEEQQEKTQKQVLWVLGGSSFYCVVT